MPDLSSLFAQMQSLMQPYDGPLNWDVALDLARKTAAQTPDPTPTERQKAAVADALRLADHWIDGTTAFPSGITTSQAWSRAEWLVNTVDVWKVLVEPVALQSVGALGSALPEDAQAQAAPMMGFLGKAVGALLANQTGSGIGALAGEVLSVSDIGVPLAAPGRAALLPTNIATFAEGLSDVSEDDVLLYLALREAAHQRLFAGVPWLRDHVIGAVTDYARGVEVNLGNIQQQVEEQLQGVNPSDPQSLQQLFENGSLFEMPDSPAQKAALERLEIVLALVEGWVDEIVSEATDQRMPAATRLQEAFRRRRAAGGPAEQTFATLVGLELRPRRLRDASTLWGSLRTRQGAEARDGVWMSPALLPTSADLDDPLGFREGADSPSTLSEDEFDAELRKLLDGPSSGEDE
jgi:putative hydrolase